MYRNVYTCIYMLYVHTCISVYIHVSACMYMYRHERITVAATSRNKPFYFWNIIFVFSWCIWYPSPPGISRDP